jgi:hypothetical protein
MLWQTDLQELAKMLRPRVWRNLTEAEWTEFIGSDLGPYQPTIPWLLSGTQAE